MYPRKNVGDKDIIPVIHAKIKSHVAGLTGFYTALLEPYGNPIVDPDNGLKAPVKLAHLHEMVKHHIQRAETRIIFIDEFQHVFESRKKGIITTQVIINQLMLLMEEARVAIIPVGVLSVESFLNLDAQLAGRCPVKDYSRLESWELPALDEGIDLEKEIKRVQKLFPLFPPSELKKKIEKRVAELQVENKQKRERFRNLLKGFETNMAFPEPSFLSSPDNSELIFAKVRFSRAEEGDLKKANIRRIAWFLRKASILAHRRDHRRIEVDDLNDTIL